MSISGHADGQPGGGPMKVGVALTDILTGLYASTAILAALQAREHTGRGQHIDLALLDVGVACLANQSMNYLYGDQVPQRMGNASEHGALPGVPDRRRPHDSGRGQ
jgi:crotonobetainyl-CoA:carnitine CoA-transferase CaiB-like acyl-CoA transferase